jgi:hypothetical protein
LAWGLFCQQVDPIWSAICRVISGAFAVFNSAREEYPSCSNLAITVSPTPLTASITDLSVLEKGIAPAENVNFCHPIITLLPLATTIRVRIQENGALQRRGVMLFLIPLAGIILLAGFVIFGISGGMVMILAVVGLLLILLFIGLRK